MADDATLVIRFEDDDNTSTALVPVSQASSFAAPGAANGNRFASADYLFQQIGTFTFQQAGNFPGSTTQATTQSPTNNVQPVGAAQQGASQPAGQANNSQEPNDVAEVVIFKTIVETTTKTFVALGVAAVATVAAVNRMADTFTQRAHELEAFSPVLAEAGARAEVRQLGVNINEAQQLGPALAKVEEAQSELSQSVSELLIPIKEMLAEFTAEALDIFRAIVEILKGPVQVACEFVRYIADILANFPGVKQMLSALHEIAANTKKDFADNSEWLWKGWEELSRHARDLDRGSGADELRDQLRDQTFNLPVFAGI